MWLKSGSHNLYIFLLFTTTSEVGLRLKEIAIVFQKLSLVIVFIVLLFADERDSHTHVRYQILIQIRHVEIIFSENIYGELGIIQLGSAAKCWLLYLDLNIFIP